MFIDSIAIKLTQKLVDRDVIKFEDWDVYLFGLQLMISGIFKFVGFMLIAGALGWIAEAMVFLTAFSLLRIYAGGFHVSTYLRCFLATCLMMFISIWLLKTTILGASVLFTFTSMLAAIALVLAYAPVDTPNRRLSEGERKLNRFRSILVIFLETIGVLLICLLSPKLLLFCNILAAACLLQSITLMPAFAEEQIK